MKTLLCSMLVVIVSVVSFVDAEARTNNFAEYTWVVSASSTDPTVNSLEFDVSGLAFLWYLCPRFDQPGMSAAEFSLNISGETTFITVVPLNGFLNAGTGSDVLLAVGGCPTGPVVAGIVLLAGSSGPNSQICFGPGPNGNFGTVNCDAPGFFPNHWVGMDLGAGPCSDGVISCPTGPISIEETSWGSVKSLYK